MVTFGKLLGIRKWIRAPDPFAEDSGIHDGRMDGHRVWKRHIESWLLWQIRQRDFAGGSSHTASHECQTHYSLSYSRPPFVHSGVGR